MPEKPRELIPIPDPDPRRTDRLRRLAEFAEERLRPVPRDPNTGLIEPEKKGDGS